MMYTCIQLAHSLQLLRTLHHFLAVNELCIFIFPGLVHRKRLLYHKVFVSFRDNDGIFHSCCMLLPMWRSYWFGGKKSQPEMFPQITNNKICITHLVKYINIIHINRYWQFKIFMNLWFQLKTLHFESMEKEMK